MHNIAHSAASGKKILLVDVDPQSNLTAAVHGLSTNVTYSFDDENRWLEILSKSLSLRDIVNAIKDSPDGIDEDLYLNKEVKADKNSDNIFCINGTHNLSDFEYLLFAICDANQRAMKTNIPYRFNKAIQDVAKKLGCRLYFDRYIHHQAQLV